MDTGGDSPKTFSLTEAEKYLNVSRVTLWRLIRQYQVPTFTDVLDRRVKRVRRSDIDQILADADRVREGEAA
ncbi:MAG TPA: helix-turn-helix domain-containing protein [Pyrinomonadaceae bacterium]|nr:helix-turn-helix domain-containing protein [Pyrinomonadaceae bacterium]